MTSDDIPQVLEKLEAIPPTIEGNRDMLAWPHGERQCYEEGEKRHRHVQLIDFKRPSENVFHVSWEWKLKQPVDQSGPPIASLTWAQRLKRVFEFDVTLCPYCGGRAAGQRRRRRSRRHPQDPRPCPSTRPPERRSVPEQYAISSARGGSLPP